MNVSEAPPTAGGLEAVLSAAEPLYLLPKDDVADQVITPALSVSKSARIMIGFFASASLAEIAAGLATYLASTSEPLRLIVSPFLTADDQRALSEPITRLDGLVEAKLSAGLLDADILTQHTLRCLAWLVDAGRLEMKVALMRDALFHPKVWLFSDGKQRVALHGSANMTGSGLGRNREQLTLSRGWTGADAKRICDRLVTEFELLWSGGDADCLVLDLPDAFKARLVRDYKSDHMPTEDDYRHLWRRAHGLPEPQDRRRAAGDRPEFKIPDWLDFRAGEYAHQGQAIDAWFSAGRRGVLEMCTGSGKTLTALVAAQLLHRDAGPLLIVVTAPYRVLLEQWSREIALFGVTPVNLSEAGGPAGRQQAIANSRRRLRLGVTPAEALVVSNDTLCTPEFISEVAKFDGAKLLIADECHNLGAPSFVNAPPECFNDRLGLSATPIRQYDDIGTDALLAYFGPVCFRFGLEDAIGRCLTPYDYYPHFVNLSEDEMAEWIEFSEEISRLAWKIQAGIKDERLEYLLLQRRRVLETASHKIAKLADLLDQQDLRRLRYTLIYATDKDPRQLEAVNDLLNDKHVLFHQLTATETADPDRARRLLSSFQSGELQVLTAKRVLDEGVNVPEIERAYILASTTVRRQWVQRRGRLLRMCKEIGKTHAIIHDLVALPPEAYDGCVKDPDARKIISGELDRVWEFARLSRNGAAKDGPFTRVEKLRALLKEAD